MYFAPESAVWAGLSGASSSLLHLVSARAVPRLVLGSPKAPSLAHQGEDARCPLRAQQELSASLPWVFSSHGLSCTTNCGWIPRWVSWEGESGGGQIPSWPSLCDPVLPHSMHPHSQKALLKLKKEHVGPEILLWPFLENTICYTGASIHFNWLVPGFQFIPASRAAFKGGLWSPGKSFTCLSNYCIWFLFLMRPALHHQHVSVQREKLLCK